MAHSKNATTNIITQIKIPGIDTPYEIHDASAIHSIEDLGLSAALVFKGVKKSEAEVLAITSAKVGDVWLVDSDGDARDGVGAIQTEYVCVTEVSGTANANAWEKLGNLHNAASTTHTHDVSVSGSLSGITVSGIVRVPKTSGTTKYLSVTGGAQTKKKFEVTQSGEFGVGANGTASVLLQPTVSETGLLTFGTVTVLKGVQVTQSPSFTLVESEAGNVELVTDVSAVGIVANDTTATGRVGVVTALSNSESGEYSLLNGSASGSWSGSGSTGAPKG